MKNSSLPEGQADTELTRALRDAVSDVHPRGTAYDIERAAAESNSPRHGSNRFVLAGIAAVTVLIIGSVTLLLTRPDSPGPAATRSVDVPAYFVGQTGPGLRLFKETHRVSTTQSTVQAAVNRALQAPADSSHKSAFPSGTTAEVTMKGGAATVDLRGDKLAESLQSAKNGDIRLQALVYTIMAAREQATPVRFVLNGKSTDSIMGVSTTEAIRPMPEDNALSPVSIDVPRQGGTVGSRVKVEGRAAAPEANVVWTLTRQGKVVRTEPTTARECCTLAPYSFTLTGLTPGKYTVSVQDTDPSDGEGVGVTRVSRDFTVK